MTAKHLPSGGRQFGYGCVQQGARGAAEYARLATANRPGVRAAAARAAPAPTAHTTIPAADVRRAPPRRDQLATSGQQARPSGDGVQVDEVLLQDRAASTAVRASKPFRLPDDGPVAWLRDNTSATAASGQTRTIESDKRFFALPALKWRTRATDSLPLPGSPTISAGVGSGAARRTCSARRRIAGTSLDSHSMP